MRRLVSCFIFFCITFQLSAQAVKDSLSAKSYKELAELIQEQSRLDIEVASKMSVYYINKAKKENNQIEEFNGLDNFIQVAIWSRKFDSFHDHYRRLLILAERNKLDKELMRSHYYQANAYFFQGVWSKSTSSYYKSLEIAKQLNDVLFQHGILTQLGYLKTTTGDTKSALIFQKYINAKTEYVASRTV